MESQLNLILLKSKNIHSIPVIGYGVIFCLFIYYNNENTFLYLIKLLIHIRYHINRLNYFLRGDLFMIIEEKYLKIFKDKANKKLGELAAFTFNNVLTYIEYQLLRDPEYKDPDLEKAHNMVGSFNKDKPFDIVNTKAMFFILNYRFDLLEALIGKGVEEVTPEQEREINSLMVDKEKLNKFLIDFKESRIKEGKTFDNF
jgi:hypothetical protein